MRVGIEVSTACEREPTGVAHYARCLTTALRSVAPADELELLVKLSRWRKRGWLDNPLDLPVQTYHGHWLRRPWRRPEVVHGTEAWLPPWREPARVVTVHDLAVFRFTGEWFAPRTFRERKRRAYERLRGEADLVIVPSAATGADLVELFGYDPSLVQVVPHGIEERYRREAAVPGRAPTLAGTALVPGFVLFTGRISTRKNVGNLLAAFARSREARGRDLVLAGPMAYGGETVMDSARQLGIAARVHLAGFLSDADVEALYRAAGALLFATFYEGFGLPVLEAMACGLPVVAGTAGAAPEVAAGHAELADPQDADAIAAALDRALLMTPARRSAAARHARGFTWESSARASRGVYEAAIARRRGR